MIDILTIAGIVVAFIAIGALFWRADDRRRRAGEPQPSMGGVDLLYNGILVLTVLAAAAVANFGNPFVSQAVPDATPTPHGAYVPPRIDGSGKVVPGHIEPAPASR